MKALVLNALGRGFDLDETLMIAALRYYDTFVKAEGAWLFSERLLYVDWIEERRLS